MPHTADNVLALICGRFYITTDFKTLTKCYVYVCVCTCAHECRYQRRPEDGAGAGAIGGCELLNVGARHRTLILLKISKHPNINK